jgi:hypothetical protein
MNEKKNQESPDFVFLEMVVKMAVSWLVSSKRPAILADEMLPLSTRSSSQ